LDTAMLHRIDWPFLALILLLVALPSADARLKLGRKRLIKLLMQEAPAIGRGSIPIERLHL